jgi:hypothetical protein
MPIELQLAASSRQSSWAAAMPAPWRAPKWSTTGSMRRWHNEGRPIRAICGSECSPRQRSTHPSWSTPKPERGWEDGRVQTTIRLGSPARRAPSGNLSVCSSGTSASYAFTPPCDRRSTACPCSEARDIRRELILWRKVGDAPKWLAPNSLHAPEWRPYLQARDGQSPQLFPGRLHISTCGSGPRAEHAAEFIALPA